MSSIYFVRHAQPDINCLDDRTRPLTPIGLQAFPKQNIVVGTYGTALCTIMNDLDCSLGCDWFRRIWFILPYIIRLDFEGLKLVGTEELFGWSAVTDRPLIPRGSSVSHG